MNEEGTKGWSREEILRLEALTKVRRNDLRREHNHRQLLAAGGKPPGPLRRFRIKAYVIHCKGNEKRRKRVRRLLDGLKAAGVSASLFPCVNYKAWLNRDGTPNETFKRLYQGRVIKVGEESMTPVEYAIALSHKLALRKFSETTSYEYGIVFEDDVTLHPGFAARLAEWLDAVRASQDPRVRRFALFYLWNSNAGSTRSKLRSVRGIPGLYEETEGHNAGGPAYLFRREFADKEMRRPYPIVDTSDVHNGYEAFERYNKRMAFLTVKMKVSERKGCRRALPRIVRDRWYDDPCITSPLVHSPWYDGSSSHEGKALKDWEHFELLKQKRPGKTVVPSKYAIPRR